MIKLENMIKNYDHFNCDISIHIPAGKVSGLVGINGAGKSTTIKAILGLIKIDGGSVTTLGKDSKTLQGSDKENIGVVLSDSDFSTYLNVKDVISILKNSYTNFNEEMFVSLCQKYSLPFDGKIKDFSTGMKARLKVISAITHDADLLIMDEPTAGLDVIARNEILDMLRDYLAENERRSMLISSHISSDLEGICDDIYLIDKGKIILHEDTDVLLEKYGLLKVNDEVYSQIDKEYLISVKKEVYGYSCFTNQKQFYVENYPQIVIEPANIDEMIIMMSGGNK